MIRIENLSKRYNTILALDQLSMNIEKGAIFGLLGPNGAGKTTLISILNGLNTFEKGSIEIFGLPLQNNLTQIRKRCTFIPQSLALYDNLSVIENLRFFAGIQLVVGSDLKNNLEYAISVNHLDNLLDQKAATLSGGQKRRLNIAIGLLNNPEILYFDEPTIGIDPESRNDILNTIKSFKEDNKTVIYTSHYMDEIEKICDEAAIINHGKIILQGNLQTMLRESKDPSMSLESLFIQLTSRRDDVHA
jgi:ABC-2 type transport system ATP-binding protein